MNRVLIWGSVLAVSFLSVAPSWAQLQGTDNTPGTPCTRKGAVQMTANATGPGAYILTCDGNAPAGKWVATLNAELPTASAQVANKQYVDSAVASATSGSCQMPAADTTGYSEGGKPFFCRSTSVLSGGISTFAVINDGRACESGMKCISGNCVSGYGAGQIMPDGTIYVGPFGGYTLYAAPSDQSTGAAWKTGTGVNDIATDSSNDGLANSNQVPNSTTFPAFKLCKDLTYGGHADWYLPALNEVALLYTNLRLGITNPYGLAMTYYTSSTEVNASQNNIFHMSNGATTGVTKTQGYTVRCVRRE